MSNFVVSARKYRPSRFVDVVGQEHVTNTLKNALRNDHLAHAFLFCGPRGVGKTTCARILAKVLNCRNVGDDFEPCNTCDSCRSFNENASFNITELDAASNNSVEHIRALIEQVRFQPQQGRYKVFIIDEVHMLSQQAFNAFLKTLEEPPEYAIFILATTEKHKIIPTILSRCQIFDFKRIQVQAIVEHLQTICDEEQLQAEPEALHIMAQKADGALRDALSIFDRMVSFSGSEIRYADVIQNLNVLDYDYFFQIVDALLIEDMPGILLLFDEILNKGFDPDIFMNGLAEHLRNLLVCKDAATLQLLEVSAGLKERYLEQAQKTKSAFLLTGLNLANDCDIHYKTARNKRLHVEIALIKMAYINRAADIASITEKKIPDPNETPLKGPAGKQTSTKPTSGLATKGKKQTLPTNNTAKVPVTASDTPTPPANGLPLKAKVGLKTAGKLGDVDTMLKQLKAEEAKTESQTPARVLNLEAVTEVWENYAAAVESDSIRNLLKGIELELEGKTITATVASKLSENALRQERDLIQQLRDTFGVVDLVLKIQIDKSKLEEVTKPKKPMTDKEKLKAMYEQNPEIKQLAKRFGLRFDDH